MLLRTSPFVVKNRRDTEAFAFSEERIVYTQHVGESGEKLFLAADQLGRGGRNREEKPLPAWTTPNWVKVKTKHGRHIDEERP
jgi:hypothetical protein